MADVLKAFHYDLVVFAEDHKQADRVMIERTGYEEDLKEYDVGEYSSDANPCDRRELEPIEVDSN